MQLGRGLLPPGIEEALSTMAKQESAVFVVPAGQAAAASQAASKVEEKGGGGGKAANGAAAAAASGTALLPAPPGGSGGGGSAAAGLQVEAELELLSFVQVRDLTGTGQAIKRRLREGRGEFPLDCPLEDTTVRIHMRARQAAAAAVPPGSSDSRPWAYDSRAASGGEPLSVDTGAGRLMGPPDSVCVGRLVHFFAVRVAVPRHCTASTFTHTRTRIHMLHTHSISKNSITRVHTYARCAHHTGCGDLPDAVESAIKVMLPGEVAAVVAQPALAYGGRPDDCPPGLDAHAPVEFELELEGFDKEAHWSAAPPGERLRLAEGLKAKGNALFRAKKFKYAQARYTHLVRLLDATRDVDSEEQGAAVAALKAAACSNLALVCINTGQPHDAVRWASRALELEPTNAKALFRRGKALTAAGDYDEAEDDLRAALALEGV